MVTKNKPKEDRYIGPFKVLGILKQDTKTPMGNEVIQVLYEKHPREIMPMKAFELLVSPAPVDLTTLQKRRFDYLIPKLIEQMAEIDVRMYELVPLATRLHETITDHFERASNYLWTGDDRNWARGANFMNDRTIVETHKVLLEMDADSNSHANEGIKKDQIRDLGGDRGKRS